MFIKNLCRALPTQPHIWGGLALPGTEAHSLGTSWVGLCPLQSAGGTSKPSWGATPECFSLELSFSILGSAEPAGRGGQRQLTVLSSKPLFSQSSLLSSRVSQRMGIAAPAHQASPRLLCAAPGAEQQLRSQSSTCPLLSAAPAASPEPAEHPTEHLQCQI